MALIDTKSVEIVGQYEYEPYGKIIRSSGTAAKTNPLRFSTRFQDDETGLVFFGRRYYSPQTGCWLSRDPLGKNAGPNLYAYAENDPINRIDPIGENVYAVTRSLNITGLGGASPTLVHVYLAFDNVGIDKTKWAGEVQRLNQGPTAIDPSTGSRYKADPAKVQTLSFHPDSVRTGNTFPEPILDDQYGRFLRGLYNDRADTDPFDLRNGPGTEVEAHPVLTQSTEDQIRLFQAAIASRNINNCHPETFHRALVQLRIVGPTHAGDEWFHLSSRVPKRWPDQPWRWHGLPYG